MIVMGVKELVLHNPLSEKWAYRIKNNIFVQSSNCFFIPRLKARKNTISISGENNVYEMKEGQIVSGCRVDISGESNSVHIGLNSITRDFANNTIRITGNNNLIEIEEGTRFSSCSIFIAGNSNRIHISKDCSLVMTAIHMEQDNNSVIINEGCTFHGRDNGVVELSLDEGSNITLKRDCMVSNDVKIRSSDSHSIVDLAGNRINHAADITIAEHTWICLSSIILKGFSNGKRSVIAAGSLCTKPVLDENVILGGNPAGVLKRGVDWDRKFVNYRD